MTHNLQKLRVRTVSQHHTKPDISLACNEPTLCLFSMFVILLFCFFVFCDDNLKYIGISMLT